MRFHVDGGAVRMTSSPPTMLARRERDAHAVGAVVDALDDRAEADALRADRREQLRGQRLVAAVAADRPRCRSSTSRGRRPSPSPGCRDSSATRVSTPLSPAHHRVEGQLARAARRSSRSIQRGQRPLVERLGVRRQPRPGRASATLAASAFIWLTASSISSQSASDSSIGSRLPPSTIGASKSSSSVTSRNYSLNCSA